MGLTSVQLRVLDEINFLKASGQAEINQKDLEKIEQVTHPTMTGIIRRLENKGFIKCIPSPTDHRYKKITCKSETPGIHEKLAAQDKEVLSELCNGFSREQIDEFVHMTDLILKNISK